MQINDMDILGGLFKIYGILVRCVQYLSYRGF